ncbi:MAG: hypothetical protein K9J46_23075 [Saprospiraceae bacterium]|nr:hypothetical protein [Saprospiraceae bacterium]
MTAALLNLVNIKSQHHQKGKDGTKLFFSMSKVVLKIVVLIFERIESFILKLPPATPHPHYFIDIGFGQFDTAYPGKYLDFPFFSFQVR